MKIEKIKNVIGPMIFFSVVLISRGSMASSTNSEHRSRELRCLASESWGLRSDKHFISSHHIMRWGGLSDEGDCNDGFKHLFDPLILAVSVVNWRSAMIHNCFVPPNHFQIHIVGNCIYVCVFKILILII